MAQSMINSENLDAETGELILENLKTAENVNAPSKNSVFRDLNVMIDDINVLPVDSEKKATEFLSTVNNVRNEVLRANAGGELNRKDFNDLMERLNSEKQAEATREVQEKGGVPYLQFSFKDANKVLDNNLPPQYKAVAFREYFNSVYNKDMTNEAKKSTVSNIVQKYNNRTLEAGVAPKEELQQFDTTVAADNSGLPSGTIVSIGGRRYRI